VNNLNKIKEKFLYQIWQNKKFSNEKLYTINNDELEILDVGERNEGEDGPDFKNARIMIGGIKYVGDIEIDTNISDWARHEHNKNEKYNSVILHVFFNRDNKDFHPISSSGRVIPSLNLSQFIDEDLRKVIREAISLEKDHRLKGIPCQHKELQTTVDKKLTFLRELGIKRFEKKCNKLYQRLKEIYLEDQLRSSTKEPSIHYTPNEDFYNKEFKASDFRNEKLWMQLFYEYVFEALGYSKNKDIFRKLALELDLDFVIKNIPKENFVQQAEYVYFYVSGMTPKLNEVQDEEVKNYVKNIYENWKKYQPHFRGSILEGSKWHFFQLKPQNFPTIRLAGGVRLLYEIVYNNLLGRIMSAFEKIDNSPQMVKALKSLVVVEADGFWKNYFHFNKKAEEPFRHFVGMSRAEEIVVNVILPFIKVLSDVFGRKKDAMKVMNVYKTMMQTTDNQIAIDLANALQLPNIVHQSIFYQGLIELFREYCSKKKCKQCEIGITPGS